MLARATVRPACGRDWVTVGQPSRVSKAAPRAPLRSRLPDKVPANWYSIEHASQSRTRVSRAAGAAAPGSSPTPQPSDSETNSSFLRARLVVFTGIMLGYGCFYLTRNSLPYVAPVMEADPSLGFNLTKVGIVTSAFPIAYSSSKLVAGVLGDHLKPYQMLSFGLLATAVANAVFGLGNSLPWFVSLWIINGLFQGTGAPACARLLTKWFDSKERGTWWGIWTTSNNLGAFLAPIIAGGAARALGWRWGMFAPALIATAMSGVVMLLIKDTPEQMGFPPVDSGTKKGGSQSQGPSVDMDALGEKASAKYTVFRNPVLWAFALQYFFVYVVRQAATSWLVFYLIKAKGVEDAAMAAVRVSGLELGGLAGSLLAGKLSDWRISTMKEGEGVVGKRVQIMMACSIGMALALVTFANIPASAAWAQWASVFMIGFFLYGPQMLTGLAAAEVAGPKAVGASQGIIGLISYMGAASAGVPLSLAVHQYGWGVFFSALIASCAAIFVLLAPFWNQKSFIQKYATSSTAGSA